MNKRKTKEDEVMSITIDIKLDDISCLLTSASTGSSYWCSSDLAYTSETLKALTAEGVDIEDIEEGKKYKLNLASIKRGMKKFAKDWRFSNFIKEDYDEVDGDVFLQYCIFGEVIYS